MSPSIQRLRSSAIVIALLGLLAVGSVPAAAIVPAQGNGPLNSLAFVSERLQARADLKPIEEVEGSLTSSVRDGWSGFRGNNGLWTAVIDKRSGVLEIAEGEGIPFLPGSGNSLTSRDIAAHLGSKAKVDLAVVESITRAFLPRVASLLGVDPKSLVLNPGRSGHPADHLWFVDFDVMRGGLPVEGARVVFRIGHGNLIQFGGENLPAAGVAAPAAQVTREQALANLSSYVGGFSAADNFLDGGSLHLLTVRIEDGRFNDGFEIGKGRGLAPAWQFIFRRGRASETWRARVDAVSGEMLELMDTNDYAQVTGGAKFLGVPANVPMPFADISSGGYTNSAGIYSYLGGAVASTLNGQYVQINDNCGPISQSGDPDGNIAFGVSAGTDCSTPGSGGTGNTNSARTQFYHVNRVKEAARGWLTGNAWLGQKLVANVNINLTCNAFWNGSTINFYRSGGGCNNTGEIEAVSLHEYGHGADSNDGNGGSPDRGTGETYGDFTAALATHSSCIGSGFRASNCSGYGDACTACTGVRDIDWAKRTSNTAHTVVNFTQPVCPTSATGYIGVCGKEGHCESYISSEALWDFANRDLPSPGSGSAWATAERLWYLSRSTATGAFSCTTGATYSSNGCNTGSLWKTLRAADDDNGNLADGTPNSAALYAAFNRHLIACTTDTGANTSFRGCTQPATPAVNLTAGDNQVTVAWSGSTGVYDVYRNEIGCNAGFIKVGNDVAASPLIDGNVANGFTYYYQVVAQPAGNESCGSAPSTCMSVTPASAPCTPPAAPTGVMVTGTTLTQVNLGWNAAAGATSYRVYRSATPGGPYSIRGIAAGTTFSDTGLDCSQTWYYIVRAATSASCESPNSSEVTAATTTCPPCTTQNLYTKDFETGTGLADWTSGTFLAGGPTADWRGIQTCTAHSGTKTFRFGGAGCTDDYVNNSFSYAQPNGTGGITVPAGSRTSRLSFWHRRDFESGFDGGIVTVSVDGTNYEVVPGSAILSGTTYNGVIAPNCAPTGSAGAPSFTGTATSFTETVVDLDAACNAATGGTGGCAGQAVRIGFTTATDCSITGDGWILDDVAVSSCVPDVAAAPADYYTLTPCRLFDTRLANGPLGGPVLQPATERTFTVTGVCGVPSTAKALLLNVTVVQPASAGYVQAYPGDGSIPTTSAITFMTNQLISNNAVVSLAGNGSGTIKVRPGTTGTVHFIADVLGYFE